MSTIVGILTFMSLINFMSLLNWYPSFSSCHIISGVSILSEEALYITLEYE